MTGVEDEASSLSCSLASKEMVHRRTPLRRRTLLFMACFEVLDVHDLPLGRIALSGEQIHKKNDEVYFLM